MDSWAQSFKIIHGKSPSKADRAHFFEGQKPGCSADDQENLRAEYKGSELKPPQKTPSSSRKINPKLQKLLRKNQEPQTSFESPSKLLASFSPESPHKNNLLRTPSPRKLMRPTKACSNIHLLLKEEGDQLQSDKEEDEKQVNMFEDEMPEQSSKMKNKKSGDQPSRKRPASGFAPNYVKANLKRKRFVSKKSNAANNAKKFKRFKRNK